MHVICCWVDHGSLIFDATYGGRSNNYSFAHKRVHHVLKPMSESAIKADVFASVKKKKEASKHTPKPRTALIQEGENDVRIPAPEAAFSTSKINDDGPNNSLVPFGSMSDFVKQEDINKDEIRIQSNMSWVFPFTNERSLENTTKPRTALIREREDDEPMDHQVISKKSDENCSNVINKLSVP